MRNQGVGTHTQEVCRVGTVRFGVSVMKNENPTTTTTYAEIRFGVAYGSRLLQFILYSEYNLCLCMTMRYRSSLEEE